jgi:predicted secreted protein
MQSISIESYQERGTSTLYTSVNPIQNLITVTDSNALKEGNSSTKIQHSLHNTLDRKHTALHVKFEVDFIISFISKCIVKERGTFSGAGLFQLVEFEYLGTFSTTTQVQFPSSTTTYVLISFT